MIEGRKVYVVTADVVLTTSVAADTQAEAEAFVKVALSSFDPERWSKRLPRWFSVDDVHTTAEEVAGDG